MNPEPNTAAHAASPLWLKIPAVLAIVFCAALGLSIWRPDKAALAARYRDVARKALEQKDYAAALVASLRLLSFGEPSRNEALLEIAMARHGLGQTSEANDILAAVAPSDKPVYAPAHLYVARALIARGGYSREAETLIVAQLRNALALEPDSAEAKELLSRYQK